MTTRTIKIRRTLGQRLLSPKGFAILFVVLMASTDFKLRQRSATAALSGDVDLQVAVELAIWAAAVALTMFAWNRYGKGTIFTLRGVGPVTRSLIGVVVLIFVWSLYSPSVRSLVRAVQIVLLAVITVIALRMLSRMPEEGATQFWLWFRRSLWIAAIGAAILTALNPQWGSLYNNWTKVRRYRFFLVHPINSGGWIGACLVALVGTYLGYADPWFEKQWGRYARPAGIILFVWLLARTKSRGPLLATAAALIVLLLLSRRKRQRRDMMFLGWAGLAAGVAAVALDLGGERITRVLFRNQSSDELLSLTGRTQLLEVAWELFKQRPILGYGYLSGSSYFLEFFEWAGESHNVIIEIGFSYGVIGLFVWGILLYRLATRLFRARRLSHSVEAQGIAAEAIAFYTFIFVFGTVAAGFASVPGHQQTLLFLLVLLADLLEAWRLKDLSARRIVPHVAPGATSGMRLPDRLP